MKYEVWSLKIYIFFKLWDSYFTLHSLFLIWLGLKILRMIDSVTDYVPIYCSSSKRWAISHRSAKVPPRASRSISTRRAPANEAAQLFLGDKLPRELYAEEELWPNDCLMIVPPSWKAQQYMEEEGGRGGRAKITYPPLWWCVRISTIMWTIVKISLRAIL